MMQPRSQHTGSVHSSQPLSSCSRLQRRVPASRPLQGAGRWPVRSCRQGMAGASLAIVLGAAARPSGAPLKGAWPVCLQGSLVRGCRCVITPVESVSWLEGPLLYSVTRDGPPVAPDMYDFVTERLPPWGQSRSSYSSMCSTL